MAREGVPLIVIQRQLGHSNLGITSVYLQGIDNAEDHRHRPRPTRTDDPRQRITPTLKTKAQEHPLIAQQHSSTGTSTEPAVETPWG
jgi:integrase